MAVSAVGWHLVTRPACAPGWPLATSYIEWEIIRGIALCWASPSPGTPHPTPTHITHFHFHKHIRTPAAHRIFPLLFKPSSLFSPPSLLSSSILSSPGLYFLFGGVLSPNHLLSLHTHSVRMRLLLCHTEGTTPSACAHFY